MRLMFMQHPGTRAFSQKMWGSQNIIFLFAFRIDQILLDYYGPEIYERYTSSYYDANSPIGIVINNDNKRYVFQL